MEKTKIAITIFIFVIIYIMGINYKKNYKNLQQAAITAKVAEFYTNDSGDGPFFRFIPNAEKENK
ncbi:MAG: hypothetical protein AABY32_01870 [Nanoarchaeota archaeon]